MLLVIPYCANDVALVSQLLDYLPEVGPYEGHQCLLVTTHGCKNLSEKAEKSFDQVSFHEVNAPEGWPAGPNGMFSATARHIFATPEFTGSWMWCEPDATPMRKGWLDEIQTEYFAAHQPFLGAVVPTRIVRDGEEIVEGEHMNGCGVYPKDTPIRLALFDTIKFSPQPFDAYVRWELVPQCHPTGLIQNGWRTGKAVRHKNGITLKPMNEIAQSARLRKETAFYHGCRDGSLIRLLQEAA